MAPRRELEISRSRAVLFSLLLTVLGLAALELGARALEPVVYQKSRQAGLEDQLSQQKLWQQAIFLNFGGLHETDPDLLWRFRPGLALPLFRTDSHGLLSDHEVALDKPPGTFRILVLGDSSGVGLGLNRREEAFGEVAARMLQQRWGDRRRVELVNTSVSGYSSEQAKRMLRDVGLRYQPDVVVVYLGNNDASINGYLSDREVFEAQDWSRGARSLLNRLALYRVLRGVLSPVASAGRAEGGDQAGRQPRLRVSPQEYGENLREIIAMAKSAGARVVLVNPPVPLRWPAGLQFKIFAQRTDAQGRWVVADPLQQHLERPVAYAFDPRDTPNRPYGRLDPNVAEVFASAYRDDGDAARVEARYQARLASHPDDAIALNNLGVLRWREKLPAQAADLFQRSLQADPSLNVARFNLGIALDDEGQHERSLQVLREALDDDVYSLRIKTPYREQLFAAAQSTGTPVLDAAALFAAQGNEQLFVDHCHPTAEGHRIIAQGLVEMLDGGSGRPSGS